MSAPAYQTANVPASPSADYYAELEDMIDAEAATFPEPAAFRASLARVLAQAQHLDVDAIAAALAWDAVARVVIALQKFSRPAVTFDALRCALHANTGKAYMADYARKHRISRVSFYNRVLRVSKLIGVKYRRTKPRKPLTTDANRA